MNLMTSFLSALLITAPALALAEDDPGVFTRTMRGLNEFFGGGSSAQVSAQTDGRFSPAEIELIRQAVGARGGVRHEDQRDYNDDYDDDYDDDDYEHDDDDQGKGHKYKKDKKNKHAKKEGKNKKQKTLPPGLRKKLERGGQLPPGWQKKFARGEVVSADVYAQAQPLPANVLGNIATVPGTELIQVNDRVARVLTETREILDVINLVTGQPY